ncbi:transcriptional regulator YqjI [Abditibacteriota bacterium]|nr:transcriptional regulator YqjI [Abditibacteriota bacterium]
MKIPESLSTPPARAGKGCGPRGERMERGMLRLLVLESLLETPKHGYEIIKTIEGRAGGQYAPSPGVIYPTLQLLEDEGNVHTPPNAERRIYEITISGRAEVELHREKTSGFWARFETPPIPEGAKREVGFLTDELEAFGRTIWTGLADEIERGDKEAIRRLRLVVQECHERVRSALAEV